MAPTLAFQRQHKVPLWIDQLMCAPKAEHGAADWLNDSFTILRNSATGLHFSWWTWKGDTIGDPTSMSVLDAPAGAAGRVDLGAYTVDQEVLEVYRLALAETAPSKSEEPATLTSTFLL